MFAHCKTTYESKKKTGKEHFQYIPLTKDQYTKYTN